MNKRSPVLIELIIIILSLSIALTVVVQIFAQVYRTNKELVEETNAVIAMQDIAEGLKADPTGQESRKIPYAENFLSPSKTDSRYFIQVDITPVESDSGTLYNYTLTACRYGITDELETIAVMTAACYVPKEVRS